MVRVSCNRGEECKVKLEQKTVSAVPFIKTLILFKLWIRIYSFTKNPFCVA